MSFQVVSEYSSRYFFFPFFLFFIQALVINPLCCLLCFFLCPPITQTCTRSQICWRKKTEVQTVIGGGQWNCGTKTDFKRCLLFCDFSFLASFKLNGEEISVKCLFQIKDRINYVQWFWIVFRSLSMTTKFSACLFSLRSLWKPIPLSVWLHSLQYNTQAIIFNQVLLNEVQVIFKSDRVQRLVHFHRSLYHTVGDSRIPFASYNIWTHYEC